MTPLTVDHAKRHVHKAEEYLRSAQAALAAGDVDAAGGNAALAGVNAADGVSGLVQGNRWNGPHEQAAAHVQRAGMDGKAVAAQLRRLLREKTRAHDEATRLTPSRAEALVLAAERAVAAARRALARHEVG